MSQPISAADPHPRRRATVLDTDMAYVSQEITVSGSHFIQEDSPAEIGQAIAAFLRRIP